tara:strand:- start:780 stop:1133 length:354 start_codon:yes stop_codon:yes gene_type:complete
MRLSTYFFLIFLTLNVLANEIPSVGEYIKHESSDRHNAFVLGLENGLEWANDEFYRKHAKQLFCKPSEMTLPIKEIKKLISDQLERDSSFYDKYADAPLIGLALKNAYIRKFPCVDK